MATERLSMRKTREILRLKWLRRSHREITRALGVSLGTVSEAASRARPRGLDWEAVAAARRRRSSRRGCTHPRSPTSRGRAAGPGGARPGAASTRRDAAAAAPRVPGEEPGRLRLHEFCVATASGAVARAGDAAGAHRRRQGVRRLLGEEAATRRSDDRRGHRGRAVRRGARRVELHVRGGDAHAAGARLDRRATCARFEYFGGVPAAIVPDQLKSGVTRADRYEPGVQRTLRGARAALRHDDPPGASGASAGQGEGGGRRADRAALDPRAASATRSSTRSASSTRGSRELLDELNARVMRRYGTSRRELFERLERPALRALPATRFVYARVEEGARQHRLPRRRRRALLLGAVPARARGAVGALTARRVELFHDAASASPRTCAATNRAATRRDRRTCRRAPEARGVDARRASSAGPGKVGARDARARRGDPRRAPSSRARLPLVPGHLPTRQEVRRTRASRRRALARSRSAARSYTARRIDPQARPRSRRSPSRRADVAIARPRERARAATTTTDAKEREAMLTEPTVEKLQDAPTLGAMAAAWDRAARRPEDRTLSLRRALRDARRRRAARAREQAAAARAAGGEAAASGNACIEDIDYAAKRELDGALVRQLATCRGSPSTRT